MAIPREQFLDILKDSFSAYYTIVENIDTDLPLAFRADYRLRDERYWLTKSVKIWGNEKNEYCKVVLIADSTDPDTVTAVRKKSFTKNYRFGLHGYSNLLAGLTDLGTEQTVTNREGHELVPYFKKLFAARAKD